MTINGNVLTEKGQLKAAARTTIADKVNADITSAIQSAERITGKNEYVLPIADGVGNTVYVNFSFTVSTVSASDHAVRKHTTKKKGEPEVFEVQ